MTQYLRKYKQLLLLAIATLLLPGSLAAQYVSKASGAWDSASTWILPWTSAPVPPQANQVVQVTSGYTVTGSTSNTYELVVSGTLILESSYVNSGGGLTINDGGVVAIMGDLTSSSSINISGTGKLFVQGNFTQTGGSDTINNSGIIVVGGDFTQGWQTTNLKSMSTILVVNDYSVQGNLNVEGSPTIAVLGTVYGSGCSTCVSTISTSHPAWLLYAQFAWWEDHTANPNGTIGATTAVCNSTTFSVNATTTGAGDMAANTFEWAVYGGTIGFNNGGTPISDNSGMVDGHTASVLSYYGISNQTAYTITVNWTDNNFTGAYVAVRQTSADNCSDGKWSVFPVSTSIVAAPTATSPQEFCANENPTIANLVATGESGATFKWYTSVTGGTALSATTALETGTYYVSQTVGTCESSRVAVNVVVYDFDLSANVTDESCSLSNGQITLTSGGTVGATFTYAWTKTGDANFSASTKNITGLSAGQYNLIVTGPAGCTFTQSYTVGTVARVLTISCPNAATAACFSSLPVVTTFAQFTALGGSWTDSCNDEASLTISTNDVISTTLGCSVTRTYTISASATNTVSCTQIFTLTDTTNPVLTCGSNIETNPNNGCTALVSIAAPEVTDACLFVDPNPSYYYYPGNNTALAKVEGSGDITTAFPVGTTTIYWSITDDCGNTGTCTQVVTVSFPVTYDGGQLQTANGPGMNPVQTSTHTYVAVDAETDRTNYTYNWQLFDSSNNEVTSGFNVTTNGTYSVSIQFGTTATPIDVGNYTLRVTKTDAVNACSISSSLPITIQENDFNVSVAGEEICQSGETGTTELEWVITMASTNAVSPFSLSYQIVDNQTSSVVCGVVSLTNISFAGAGSYTGTSSCSTIGINPATKQLYISYIVTNSPGVDKAYKLELTGQTDAYQVSDPVLTNNNATGTAHGVPATSDITTN